MLPRSQRLVAAADHRLVARRGRRCRRGALVVKLIVVDDSPSPARLAVVVPKPIGSAPVRNRLRRRLQHLAAPHLVGLPLGCRVVVRAESGAEVMSFQQLGDSLAGALVRAASA